MVNIQGLFYYDNKTKEYLIRIGNLLFPFKSTNEVYAYFLELSKKKKGFKNQKMENEFDCFNTHKQTKTMSLSPLSSLSSLSLSQRLRLASQLSLSLSKKAEAFPSNFVCMFVC